MIAVKEVFQDIPTDLDTVASINEISKIIFYNPSENHNYRGKKTSHALDKGKIAHTSTEFINDDNNMIVLTTGDKYEHLTLAQMILKENGVHNIRNNAQALHTDALYNMDRVTYENGYSPLDSITVPNWIGLTDPEGHLNSETGVNHNPLARTYWHCKGCGYFKLHVKGTDATCDSCEFLDMLYEPNTARPG